MPLQPTQALIYDAHDYTPKHPDDDPHGHDTDCECSPACECGSARDAFIHTAEARQAGKTLLVRSVSDEDIAASGDETFVKAIELNPHAVITQGVDTRVGTPLETQEPGTQRVAVDEALPEPEETEEPAPEAPVTEA